MERDVIGFAIGLILGLFVGFWWGMWTNYGRRSNQLNGA
jgi:ABC-type nitrate/sulfonate/bicarbonate transport system permease component